MEGMIRKTGSVYRPKKVRVWGKGQFTIPAELRERLGINEDTVLEVYQAGNAIIATPVNIAVKGLAELVQGEMAEKEIELEDLLAELREGNHEYSKE